VQKPLGNKSEQLVTDSLFERFNQTEKKSSVLLQTAPIDTKTNSKEQKMENRKIQYQFNQLPMLLFIACLTVTVVAGSVAKRSIIEKSKIVIHTVTRK